MEININILIKLLQALDLI